MTPLATAVASHVPSLARPEPRTRIARRSASGGADAARFGFQEEVDIPEALRLATEKRLECDIDLDGATYFLSCITIRVTDAPGMHRWRKRLFVAVVHNAASRVDFRLPHEPPITMGWQVPL
jgi:KUP system potassium uptake protein